MNLCARPRPSRSQLLKLSNESSMIRCTSWLVWPIPFLLSILSAVVISLRPQAFPAAFSDINRRKEHVNVGDDSFVAQHRLVVLLCLSHRKRLKVFLHRFWKSLLCYCPDPTIGPMCFTE